MELKDYQRIFEDYVSEENLFPNHSFVFAMVSGGKDSIVMSYLLKEYAKKKSLKLEHLNVVFPQMVFGLTHNEIKSAIDKIGKGLKRFKSRVPETSYDELEQAESPCLLCKQVRRKIIAEMIAHEKKQNIIIATGHNNYDLLAYFTELFGTSYKEVAEKGIDYEHLDKMKIKDEHLEHFSHFFPRLELQRGILLVKPVLIFSRLDIEDMFCQINDIPKPEFTPGCGVAGFVENCPYAKERPKRIMFEYLSKFPKEHLETLTKPETYKEMLSALKQKAENYQEALDRLKKTNYEELLF